MDIAVSIFLLLAEVHHFVVVAYPTRLEHLWLGRMYGELGTNALGVYLFELLDWKTLEVMGHVLG